MGQEQLHGRKVGDAAAGGPGEDVAAHAAGCVVDDPGAGVAAHCEGMAVSMREGEDDED